MDYLLRVASDVLSTFVHNWPFLLLSVVAAAALTVYVGTDRLAGALSRHVALSVVAAVALATLTPFCSCGTTAAVLGMMAVSVPWAPVVAFLVASPLTSPSELLLSAGADWQAKDAAGLTAWDHAQKNNLPRISAALQSRSAHD